MSKALHFHERLKKGYGWKPKHPTTKFPLYGARVEAGALPSQVDLRPQYPAVYDQGQLGSCTGNGWAGAVEFLFLKQGLPDFTPSRLFIYYNERVIDGDTGVDAGAAVSDGASVVSTLGCPHEALWPYDINKFAKKPDPDAYQDGLKHLAFQAQQVAQDLTTMKEVVAGGHPLVIGFTVYKSFESTQVEDTGIVPMPGYSEPVVGGHCVVIVGYDDTQSSFIIRNSWGNTWGLNGYALMPYMYLTNPRLASDFWTIGTTE
jgi:C1A family cysteine protease